MINGRAPIRSLPELDFQCWVDNGNDSTSIPPQLQPTYAATPIAPSSFAAFDSIRAGGRYQAQQGEVVGTSFHATPHDETNEFRQPMEYDQRGAPYLCPQTLASCAVDEAMFRQPQVVEDSPYCLASQSMSAGRHGLPAFPISGSLPPLSLLQRMSLQRKWPAHPRSQQPFDHDQTTAAASIAQAIRANSVAVERIYPCDMCENKFSSRGHLVRHARIHTGERPFTCHRCHKRFARRGHLVRHARTHTGERPFYCELCDKTFSRSDSLNRHMRVHIVHVEMPEGLDFPLDPNDGACSALIADY